MARVTGSTMTEEVSCMLWLDTSLEPGEQSESGAAASYFTFSNQKQRPCFTCNLRLKGASHNVVRAAIFDGDEIVSRGHWGVSNLVTLWTLHTIHLHFGGPVDGHGEGPGACSACIYHKLARSS